MQNIHLALILAGISLCYGQHKTDIVAVVDSDAEIINIQQSFTFYNSYDIALNELYFTDWTSSYSSPETPLTKKFLNEFNTNLYISRDKHRGYTTINSIQSQTQKTHVFNRLANQTDIIKVDLDKALLPGDSITLDLEYQLTIQNDRFTGYGINKKKDYALNAWYLTPAVFDGQNWRLYSNKNLDDLYAPGTDTKLKLTTADTYNVYTALNELGSVRNDGLIHYTFEGNNITDSKIFITSEKFRHYTFEDLTIQLNTNLKKISPEKEKEILERINGFSSANIAVYPKNKLILSNLEYKKNSLYGLTFLPDILSPFSKEFEYEITLAQNIIKKYIDEVLKLDSRTEYWLKKGIEQLLLVRYIETYYPDQKLLGKLADFWGIRGFNFSKLKYTEQYRLTYYQMLRTGRDQALNTKREELINFNQRHAAKFKAGLSLKYLMSYLGQNNELLWIQEFIDTQSEKPTSVAKFKTFLGRKTKKNIEWYFEDYIVNSINSDYKFKNHSTDKDSIYFTIKNLRKGKYPISLSTLKDEQVISNEWIEGFDSEKQFSIANNGADELALNYDHSSLEFNRRNNWKRLDRGRLFNKPLQFRFLRDVEDPAKAQIYFIPIVEFQNIYDGLKLGMNFNNRGLLAKPFLYALAPFYGLESKTMTGFAKAMFNIYHEDSRLYNTMFGITFDRSSFDYGSFITKIQPYVQFQFREINNLRSNASETLMLRYINIQKDNSRSFLDENTIPPYKVLNLRYLNLDNSIHKFDKWSVDLQFSGNFGKLSSSYEIRKRTPNDRHYNLRLFAGAFLYNTLPETENNFNFALDRPTDYLFEYNYLGQSESSGILAQQLVIADGGFKSKTEPGFANQWLTTLNASASIWRYIQAYGDLGFVKNKGLSPFFAYDAGVRLDLVTDFFEIYFPVYSNLGWEINQSNYPQKIRFVFTTDFSALAELFTRRWF